MQYSFVKLQLSHYCYVHYHTRTEQVYNTVTTDQGTEVVKRFPTPLSPNFKGVVSWPQN